MPQFYGAWTLHSAPRSKDHDQAFHGKPLSSTQGDNEMMYTLKRVVDIEADVG